MTGPPKLGLWLPEPEWITSHTDNFDIFCEKEHANKELVDCYQKSLEETNGVMVNDFRRQQMPRTRAYIVDASLRGLSKGAAFTTSPPGDARRYVLSFPSFDGHSFSESMTARVRAIVRHEVTHLYNWRRRPPLEDSSLGWRLLDEASALYMANEAARYSLPLDYISPHGDVRSAEEKLLLMRCIVGDFGLGGFFQFWDHAPESAHPCRALAEHFGQLRWLDRFALNAPNPEGPGQPNAPRRISDCLLFPPKQLELTDHVPEHLDEHSRHYHQFLIIHNQPTIVKVSVRANCTEPTMYVGAFMAVPGTRGFEAEPSRKTWGLRFRSRQEVYKVWNEADTRIFLEGADEQTRLVIIAANLTTQQRRVVPKATDYELDIQCIPLTKRV